MIPLLYHNTKVETGGQHQFFRKSGLKPEQDWNFSTAQITVLGTICGYISAIISIFFLDAYRKKGIIKINFASDGKKHRCPGCIIWEMSD